MSEKTPQEESDDVIDHIPPVDIPPTVRTGDPVEDLNTRVESCMKALKSRGAYLKKQKDVNHDVGFYTVIVFQSAAQKKKFCQRMGWTPDLGDTYIDGLKLAAKMGIPIAREPWRPFPPQPHKDADKKMLRMPRSGKDG